MKPSSTLPELSEDPLSESDDIGEVLISEQEIADRVAELGARITADYAGRVPIIVSVLKGSMMFVADLMRAIDGPVEVDFMAVSSYGAATKSSGAVRILKDLDESVEGRHVLVVEDIVDTGLTLRRLLERLESQGAASVATCTLLLRESAEDGTPVENSDIDIEYVGFRLPPAFVIGYGLDLAQRYRNLPYIARYAKA